MAERECYDQNPAELTMRLSGAHNDAETAFSQRSPGFSVNLMKIRLSDIVSKIIRKEMISMVNQDRLHFLSIVVRHGKFYTAI
jgi:hypothetical protein